MAEVKRIVVNTSNDISGDTSELTTLREAITEVNQYFRSYGGIRVGAKYYIDFEADDGKTTSWVISPEIPLPPIMYGNVYFNYNNPKNVTITGEKLKETAPPVPSSVLPRGQNQFSSLMTLGDFLFLNTNPRDIPDPSYYWSYTPKFYFKNFNFSSNKAQGENGKVPGGGGGLGAGGGVSIVNGSAYFEDVVFQNLKAIGGVGGKAAQSGGHGASCIFPTSTGWGMAPCGSDPNKGSRGRKGGDGGRPGSYVGEYSFGILSGGSGGELGNIDAAWKRADLYNTQPAYDDLRGGYGAKGESPFSYSSGFGFGGGGGGGGAGGSQMDWFGIWKGEGGTGGDGGDGGFGAGGGGAGGDGADAGSWGCDEYGSLSSSSPGKGGEFGSGGGKGMKRAVCRSTVDIEQDNVYSYSGGGGHGAGLGGALAVLHPNASVELVNVDFYNNTATSNTHHYGVLFSRSKEPGSVSGRSINVYDSAGKKTEFEYNQPIDDLDFHSYISLEPKPASEDFLFDAASFVRDDDLAKIRDPKATFIQGKPEIARIRFEQPKSTVLPLELDASSLENELNDIYKRIIPVESDEEIKNRLKQKQITAALDLASEAFNSFGSDLLFKSIFNDYKPDDDGSGVATDVGKSIGNFFFSIFNGNAEYEEEVKLNNANIKLLASKTKSRKLLNIKPINIGQARSFVEIKDFTVGEDKIYLEDFASDPGPDGQIIYGPKITTGNSGKDPENNTTFQSFEIHINNKGNLNTSTRVATVFLDRKSISGFSNGKISSPIAYLNSLLRYDSDQNRWVLGTTLTDPAYVFQTTLDYVGGPAGELRVIKRGVPNHEVIRVEMLDSDDIIYGTDGNEKIISQGGNDQIFPGLGEDVIYAGDSFDKVDYQSIRLPISVVGSTSDEVNQQGPQSSSFKVGLTKSGLDFDENAGVKVLSSTLLNAEAVVAFGPSVFDLEKLPAPDKFLGGDSGSHESGYYAIRTGSGSMITGSSFQSSFIISMFADENISDYLESRELTNSLKVLTRPSIISSSGDNDSLLFAFESGSPSLEIVDLSEAPPGLDGYKAVVQDDNLVIAFIKGLEEVGVANSNGDGTFQVLMLNDIPLNLQTLSTKDLKSIMAQNNSISSGAQKRDSEASLHTHGSLRSDVINLDGYGSYRALAGHDTVKGHAGDDIVYGGSGSDHLHGARGHDRLAGNRGKDTLIGGQGHDKLRGGAGDDFVHGGAGSNTLKGGSGYDYFYVSNVGFSKIKDFDPLQDSLYVSENIDKDDLSIGNGNELFYQGKPIAKLG